jgi:ribose transport system substrate-binding protein
MTLSTMTSRRTAAALLAVGASLLAACGSSDDADSPAAGSTAAAVAGTDATSTAAASTDAAVGTRGVAEAKSLVTAALASPPFVAPPAFDPSAAKGKTVWWIGDQSSDIIQEWTKETGEALKSVGVNLKVIDPKTNDDHIKGFELAIAGKAAAIVLGDGRSPVQFAAQVKAAKDAGIPFFSLVSGTPAFQPKVDGLALDVSYDYVAIGKLLADWFVADSDGKGNVLLIESPDIPSSTFELNGFRDEVKRLAPDAKVKTEKYSITSEADGGAATVAKIAQTAITGDPSLNYVIPAFDSVALQAEAGVKLAGAADRIKLAGFNSIVPQMQALKRGDSPFKADIGGVNVWLAYALADNVLRSIVGQELVADPKVGYRLFTNENVQDLNVDAEDSLNWYGIDYPALYKPVWGTP